jgi:hypothetical protein
MNSSPSSASAGGAPPRAHACVLCQQRKVKCSRETPCSACIKSRVECVYRDPAPPRRRKRRNPEDVLLARLKRYEELLQNAGVKVVPIGGANGGAAEDERVDERGSRQTSAVDDAGRNEVDEHYTNRTQPSDSLSTETTGGRSAYPGRFIFEEGRSRYLEK